MCSTLKSAGNGGEKGERTASAAEGSGRERTEADTCLTLPPSVLSQGLADSAVVARVDGVLWDLDRPLEGDCALELVKFDEPDGQYVFWHSSAHMLGEAMERHYGGCLCYGPPIGESAGWGVGGGGERGGVWAGEEREGCGWVRRWSGTTGGVSAMGRLLVSLQGGGGGVGGEGCGRGREVGCGRRRDGEGYGGERAGRCWQGKGLLWRPGGGGLVVHRLWAACR